MYNNFIGYMQESNDPRLGWMRGNRFELSNMNKAKKEEIAYMATQKLYEKNCNQTCMTKPLSADCATCRYVLLNRN